MGGVALGGIMLTEETNDPLGLGGSGRRRTPYAGRHAKKNLDTSPDETRTFDHGQLKTATVGEFKLARELLEPGWKWSEHIVG
jgi:hypothetical protein